MKRIILTRIVPALVLLLALALLTTQVIIPLFDTSDELKTFVPDIKRFAGTEDDLTLQSEHLTFTMDPETTHFTVTDNRTGKVWSSMAPGVADDKDTMLNEKERLQSIFTLDYKDNTGKQTTFSSFAKSVSNRLYEVERDGDTIRVTFTVGNIDRTYLYPEAITDARMQTIMANLAKKDKRTIEDAYQLKGEGKWKKNDDQAALKAAYPDLNNELVWIIRKKDMKTNAATKLEAAMAKGGYTAEDYAYDESRIVHDGEIEGATKQAVFNVTLAFHLEGDDLVVEVPLSAITYNPSYAPTAINLLPAFGAAGPDETGYILVPEGAGAIINYNNGKTKQNPYYANLYGWDWAQMRKEVVSETRIAFPVFGMATQGNAFVCIMEEGTSWAGVNADIAGRPGRGSYNSANAVYTLIHGDSYDVSERTNNTVYMFEQQLPDVTLRQRYRFLNSDSYMDMAGAYREYLLAKHPEMNRELSGDAHTVIELVGAIDKVQQRMGVPTNVPIPLTTYKQATELLQRLNAEKLPNLTLRYTGWMNGGLNQTILNKLRLMKEMGSEAELKAFVQAAKNAGVPLYLDGLTQFAKDSGLKEGFMAMRDAAQFTTREEVEVPVYSTVWYGPDEYQDTYYLVKPRLTAQYVNLLSDTVAQYGAAGVSFRDLGGMLSGDYNAKDLVTREEVLNQQVSQLKTLREKGQLVMTRQGNDYAAVLSDIVTDLDFDGLQYRILDAYVPFYTAALHGSVPYTGVSINLADDREELLLRSAEMGASLQYTLMADDVEELQESWYSYYYGADASIIYDDVVAAIRQYTDALSGTFNQQMTGHSRTGDVTTTEYANGIRVYVNYGYTDASVDGITIPARSYTTAKEAIE